MTDGTSESNRVNTHCIVCDARFTTDKDKWDHADEDRWRCDQCKRDGKQLRWKLAGVESETFASQPFDQRLYDLACGYLQSSKILCITLGDNPDEMTWPRASVVCFTSYHAVELFLKACPLCQRS